MFCQVNPSRDSSCNVERGASVKSTDSNDSIEYTDQGVCYETKIIGGVPVKIMKVLVDDVFLSLALSISIMMFCDVVFV